MKRLIIICSAIALIIANMISCKKHDNIADNNKWVYLDSANTSNIRAIHIFAGNTPQLPTAAVNTGPQVFIYANGAKLNGTALSYGGFWPAPNVYANLTQTGSVRFDVVMARLNFNVVPNVPAPIIGDTLLTTTAQLDKGKYYSLYFGDSIGGPYKLEVKEDILATPAYQKYKLRLANWSMNQSDTFDVFSKRENTTLINNITIKQISNWIELPLPIISDTLEVRKKNTTVPYVSLNGFSPTGLRMYTLLARGKNGVTGKTNAAVLLTNR